MVKRKLKKLLALALSILMLSSSVTGLIPTAAAQEPETLTPLADAAGAGAGASSASGSRLEFNDPDNGRPNLFVDFLGDNASFQPGAHGAAAQLNTLVAPAGFDQSKITNPDATTTDPISAPVAPEDAPGNWWESYKPSDVVSGTIFWVGLGIDRKEVFELLEGGKGLTGIEAGFYYDNRYIEPYVAPGSDYKATIAAANINNTSYPANTQWSADYEILRAETALDPKTDRITQEELDTPTIDNILTNADGSDWKMTYISLELTDLTKDRRLQDAYKGVANLDKDGEGNPITPDAAHGTGLQGGKTQADSDYQYLLLVPFKLKVYGDPNYLCLRLMRNATHFSIGGGTEGTEPYAAWERVTTRNPGKDIKLLTRFTGDLNLFGEGKHPDVEYQAKLVIVNHGGAGNRAKLSVDGDPAVWPVYAEHNNEVIGGLRSGLGMKLETTVMSGYTVTVTVTYWQNGTPVTHNYKTVVDQKKYTFVMPSFAPPGVPVEVKVVFDPGDTKDFNVYLSELQMTDGTNLDTGARKVGNEASVITNLNTAGAATSDSKTISTFSPPASTHPDHTGTPLHAHGLGPVCTATKDKSLRIDVSAHADYEAVVRIYDFSASQFITSNLIIKTAGNDHTLDANATVTPSGGTPVANPNFGQIVLPYGGSITLPMPSSDIDVEIVYRKARQYDATLEVFHVGDGVAVTDLNTAQLARLVYDDENVASRAYSGVVFEDKNIPDTPGPGESYVLARHRAVKDPSTRLPWVTNAESSLSLSLGGDTGRVGSIWNPEEITDANKKLVVGPTTVMTRLSDAPAESDFQGVLTTLDLNRQTVTGSVTGLRYDLQGNLYGADGVASLEALLWEMRQQIMADTTVGGLKATYHKSVTTTVPGGGATTTVYTYLDLTPAQVQAYILGVLEAEESYRVANLQYRDSLKKYQTALVVYDTLKDEPALSGLIAPEEPAKPLATSVDATTFVRSYQGTDYHNVADTSGSATPNNGYLYDYDQYIAAYQTYIDDVKANGALPATAPTLTAPTAKAAKTVPILSDAAAVAKVDGYTWKESPVKQNTPTDPAHTIQTRTGREVWVAMEADSAYTFRNVEIYAKDPVTGEATGTALTTITPAGNTSGYRNVVKFTMPDKDCVVRVNYEKRTNRDLRVEIIGADSEADNLAIVEAYRVTNHGNINYPSETPAVTPTLEIISNAGQQSVDPYPEAPPHASPAGTPDPRYIYQVFENSTVTVRVKHAKGYKVTVTAQNSTSGTSIPITTTTAVDPADGEVKTFAVVPQTASDGRDIYLKVVYEKDVDTHDAFITYDQNGATGSSADWHLEDTGGTVTLVNIIRNVSEGEHLLADIVVPAGSHIYGVVVWGESGSYPYTLSGNGYNGGYGTAKDKPEHIWVDMPNEDLHVHVVFKKGIPDPEPMNTLSLTVKDDDNDDDPNKAAANWAKATVYDTAYDLGAPPATLPAVHTTLGKVGKNKDHGNGTLVDWDFVPTGKWVKVEFNAADGYYVSKVTVGPSHLGVTTVWEDTNTISFYMPAGSTGINVEFKKGAAPTYVLTVRETWMDNNFVDVTDNSKDGNYVTTASSSTILGWNSSNPTTLVEAVNPERVPSGGVGTGAAKSGEEVTLTFNVDTDNWYIQSVVILADGAAYRGKYRDTGATKIENGKTYHVYEVKFRQPTGDVEVTVHYRKGSIPDIRDYALTAILYDDDNVGDTLADNRLDLTITGTNYKHHSAIHLGKIHPDNDVAGAHVAVMNAVRHPHAGDKISLKTTLADGYSVQYLVIDPASLKLYPVWGTSATDAAGVTTATATFTMPAEGVAVVARYVKGAPHKYTANLILRPPQKEDGTYYSMSEVGKGTFTTPTGGRLDGYPNNAVFSTVQPTGTNIGYDLYANDGFYIEKVTIDPAVGATGSLSGSFGYQNGDFVMPGADVNVNVWFKKGWPDEVKYALTLEVVDSSYSATKTVNNSAAFRQTRRPDGTVTALDNNKVYGQQSKTLFAAAYDRDTVVVDVNPVTGYYTNAANIKLTDTGGNTIPWWYVPGGIAFTMPPRSTTVRITFLPEDPSNPRDKYQATLVLEGADATKGDAAELKTDVATATGSPVTTDGGVISTLYPADVLALSAKPGDKRHISAVYAVVVDGDHAGEIIPIYDADGSLAGFVPGDSDAAAPATAGSFAMPEGNVKVHVKFADGAIATNEKPVQLIVSGPAGSGSATADVENGKPAALNVTATGMDTSFTDQGSEVLVTFEPTDNSASGGDVYKIAKLEVYDRKGAAVPYEWVSMVQGALSGTNTWPPPPNRPHNPGNDITYPSFTSNPKQQIKLTVPLEGVTVHVTYEKVDKDKTYVAQVVVNDDQYPSSATEKSRNNAWFETGSAAFNKKLKEAKPGEWVDLSLTVHPGYMIEYIVVIPQSFGISPALPMGPYYDQATGFYMPAGDVTVYVKFVTDPAKRYNATLVVDGAPTGNSMNFATISSPISGKSKNVTVGGTPQAVQARPVTDWVTVDYQWDVATSSIASITVKTTAGDDVPFTQNPADLTAGTGQLILPMVAHDVIVTITYRDNPDPVTYPVTLHVLDHTTGKTLTITDAWGKLDYNTDSTGNIAPADPANTATLNVPAGQRVDVSAMFDNTTLTDLKLESAYVIYEAGGQMINLNLPNTVTPNAVNTPSDSFIVHPGTNDVYISFTDKTLPPNPHTAILMLKAPEDNAGSAGISVGDVYDGAGVTDQDSLPQANHGYASVVAGEGNDVYINVIPAQGYVIDHILVTPLGFPLETAPAYDFTRNGNTYSFHMPHCNIAITVYLKRGSDTNARVILHYLQDPDPAKPRSQVEDYAKLSWTPEGESTHSIWADDNPNAPDGTTGDNAKDWDNVSDMLVQVGAEVTLSATLDTNAATGKSDTILAAYVLWDGALVPLTPNFPTDRTPSTGLEGVQENASQTDNTKADAVATFIMPDTKKDVDVFLVTTNDPPPVDWHTIVVVATDTAPSGNNSGLNKGYLNLDGAPDGDKKTAYSYGHMYPVPPAANKGKIAHAFITVPQYKADGVTPNYYTVVTDPAPGYEFKPLKSGLTKNTPAYTEALVPVSTSPYSYREPVGDSNRVVHLVFESSDALKLTVEIEDPDNPGNGTVTNAVDTTTTGLTKLELKSVSSLGSYQIMEGVTAAAPVNFVVDPETGYTAMATLKTDGDITYLTLTAATDGSDHLTGSFSMPANDSVLTVTFFKPYEGTLVLRDLTQDRTHKAKMTESTESPPDTVNVSAIATTGTLENLPNRTVLNAQMVDFDKTNTAEKVTGLLTRNGSTTFLAGTPSTANPQDPDEYLHTIDRANATITLVVDDHDDPTPDNDRYIAAVQTVNKPKGTAVPTIAATLLGAASGVCWTTAEKDNTVTVTFDVPQDYEATLTARAADGTAVTLSVTAATGPVTGQTATFTMPAKDVQVTITYRKVNFTLTLRVIDTSGVTNTTTVTPAAVLRGTSPLTADGHTAVVAAGTNVEVSAVTDPAARIKSIVLRCADGTLTTLVSAPLNLNDDYNALNAFAMPASDAELTVIYDKLRPSTPSNPVKPYYIAYTALSDPTHEPANRILSIQNASRTALDDGSPLPSGTPNWVAGYAGDGVVVSYETAPGYHVTVTATRNDTKASIPVVVLDSSTGGRASAAFPTPGVDITITVKYSTTPPPTPDPQKVALQLVAHDQKAGNKAQTNGGSLSGLALDGTATTYPPQNTSPLPGDPVEIIKSMANVGDDLRTLANWANGYQVVRMTVAVRDTTTNVETGELDLLLSRYTTSTTSRTTMPTVGANEIAVVRVYYGNVYDATLHIVGADHNDKTEGTDDRSNTQTSTGVDPIKQTGDKLIGMNGGEEVQTTAIPDTANGKRLVGVVWEGAASGADSAAPHIPDTADHNLSTDNRYDFTMPKENVDFYAVYEPIPADPKDRSYIAKVKFDPDSAHLGDSKNAVTITNASDSTAAAGKYWTAAKAGEAIVVNVKVAPGYKAEVLTARVDDQTKVPAGRKWTDDFHYYISRTAFVPNLTLGKDAAFTMPAETDATVTIRFVKGYDLSLELTDVSGLAAAGNLNAADVTTGETTARTLHGESDGTTVTYNPVPAKLTAVDGGVNITTNVTAATNSADTSQTAPYKVYRYSPFTGTVRVDAPPATATNPYTYQMPSEDTVESVLFYNNDAPLLAKVEVKGESDINGNTATPIVDHTDTTSPDGGKTPAANKTTRGTVWTTTTHATNLSDAHQIDLKLTVAKGYVAKIKVRRDNDNYYNNPTDPTKWDFLDSDDYTFTQVITTTADGTNGYSLKGVDGEVQIGYQKDCLAASAFPDAISGDQHFRFTMAYDVTTPDKNGDTWNATDVTVIVEFVFAGTIPQPFDPDNLEMSKIELERGFIYGENRGDFALVDIPTLEKDKELFDTDNYDKPTTAGATKAAQKNVEFNFFLYDAAKDEYTPLVTGTDVLLEPEDAATLRDKADPYNYSDYKTKLADSGDKLKENPVGTPDAANPENTYVRSRFKLIPTEPDETTGKRTDGAEALYKMLNNKGSLETYTDKDGNTQYRTKLYVIAEDAIGQKSAYTQVWIRPHLSVAVPVISYAPNHVTTASFYQLMSQDELDEATGYKVNGVVNTSGITQTMVDDRNFEHYRTEPPFVRMETDYDGTVFGANKYYQRINIMSSELLGGYTTNYDPAKTPLENWDGAFDARYALTLEKTSDLTYTRVDLDLRPSAANGFTLGASPVVPSYYDPATHTYTITDPIYLITGDVDGNGFTKWQDYDTVYAFVWRSFPWNNTQTEEPDPTAADYTDRLKDWQWSTYNPDSIAYRCDLNGDRELTALDVQLVQTLFDYNRSEKDYLWTHKTTKAKVLPFGFGGDKGNYAALFSLMEPEDNEPIPMEPDEYWSQLVDPETEDAPPLNTPYVDEEGNLWVDAMLWELDDQPETGGSRPADRDEDGDAVMETPMGDEILDRPMEEAHDPGEWVELPSFDPEEPASELPDADPEEPAPEQPETSDNGPGEDLSETPADITTEE